jgi:hypothetical protein
MGRTKTRPHNSIQQLRPTRVHLVIASAALLALTAACLAEVSTTASDVEVNSEAGTPMLQEIVTMCRGEEERSGRPRNALSSTPASAKVTKPAAFRTSVRPLPRSIGPSPRIAGCIRSRVQTDTCRVAPCKSTERRSITITETSKS